MSITQILRTKNTFLNKISKSSDRTLNTYKGSMNNLENYCLTLDTTIEHLIQDLTLTKDDTILEDFLQNYIDYLEQNGRVETFVKCQISFVKRFFSYSRIPFTSEHLTLSFKTSYSEEKYPLSKDEIHLILDNCRHREKTKYLLMLSGSFRIAEVLGIRKKDIDTTKERYVIKTNPKYSKGHKERSCIISLESMRFLDQIIKDLDDNDFVFSHNEKNIRYAVVNEGEIFDKIRHKSGLIEKYESGKFKISTHSFRAFFISQFEKTSSGYGHALSGHSRYMKTYDRFTIAEKIEKYLETEHYLTIFENTNLSMSKDKKELLEMKEKLARLEELLKLKGLDLSSL